MHIPFSILTIATLIAITSAAPHGNRHNNHPHISHDRETEDRRPFPQFPRPTWRFGPGHSRNSTDGAPCPFPSGVAPPTGSLFPTGVIPTGFPGIPTGLPGIPTGIPGIPSSTSDFTFPAPTTAPPSFPSVVPPVSTSISSEETISLIIASPVPDFGAGAGVNGDGDGEGEEENLARPTRL